MSVMALQAMAAMPVAVPVIWQALQRQAADKKSKDASLA
jgi:hypothetical protein